MKSKLMRMFLFLTFLPMTVVAAVLPFFPDKVPMHYNAAGDITRWGSKYEQLILPVIVIVLSGCIYGMRIFPFSKKDQGENAKSSIKVGIATLLLFNGLNFIFLYKAYAISTNINYTGVDINKLISTFMGIMFIIIGNVLPKCKQNALIGIRTFWTLKDKDVWYKTHRVGGVVMMIFGAVSSIITWFFLEGIAAVFFPVGVLLILTLVLSVYSYILYKEKQRA
jgi:uncharacterized membrane protein